MIVTEQALADRTVIDGPDAHAVLPPVPPQRTPARQRSSGPLSRHLQPGWPLTVTLVGFPLWWLIGLAEIAPLIAGVVMAVQLRRAGHIRVRSSFGWWLLFLAWVLIGGLLLQVDAPHAIPDTSSARYVTYGFRVAWYLTATVTLLYIYNLRERLSTQRIMSAFSWLFVTLVIGGIAGTLAPTLSFPSLLELLLPRAATTFGINGIAGVLHIQYVHDLVHPVMSQNYSVNGAVHPRASAPFPYTNDWGLNYGLLLPFFLASWMRRDAGWRFRVAPFVLAASLYPVVKTENRGMWIGVAVVTIVVAIRSACFGRYRLFAALAGAALAAVVVLMATPVGGLVTNRLQNGSSDSGRASLGQLTVSSVLAKSPVVGLGSTRNVEGSFYSIAGGDTAECSLCSPPALGTQGHFWLVIFSTGVGGLLLYLGFIGYQLVGSLRRDTTAATVALAVVVMHLATMFVYDTIGVALLVIFAAIGLLWRDLEVPRRAIRGAATTTGDRPLRGYRTLLRVHALLLVACLAVGAGIGVLVEQGRTQLFTATTPVQFPVNPTFPGTERYVQSLDTLAGMLHASAVVDAVAATTDRSTDAASGRLSVSAIANTRILLIHFGDPDRGRAERGSQAAATALGAYRIAALSASRALSVRLLSAQRDALTAAASTVGSAAVANPASSAALAVRQRGLLQQVATFDDRISKIEASPLPGGILLQRPSVVAASGVLLVAAASGLAIGLLCAVLLAYLLHLLSPRVGARHAALPAELPLLARLGPQDSPTLERLRALHIDHVLSGDRSAEALAATSRLSPALYRQHLRPTGSRTALVVSRRTRIRHLVDLRDSLRSSGVHVEGLVLTSEHPGGRRRRGDAISRRPVAGE